MPSHLRAIAAIVAVIYSFSAIAQMAPATAFTPSADSGRMIGTQDGCEVYSEPVYDAEGYWYQARVQMCPTFARDLTLGPNRSKPSNQLILSVGRAVAVQKNFPGRPPGMFFRGEMNKEYVIRPDDRYALAAGLPLDYKQKRFSWNNLGRALPFLPTKFYDLGVTADGSRFVAYGGLKILPSRAADAYPLNEKSIIVMMNGISFTHETSLLGQLLHPWPKGTIQKEYVEFIYFQSDDQQPIFRRAFIPQLLREAVADEWAVAASHPGAQWIASGSSQLKDRLGNYIAYAGAILSVGALLVILDGLSNGSPRGSAAISSDDPRSSSGGNNQDKNKDKERGKRPSGPPAINPFYDEPNWGGKTPR